jgi:EAL domain-containing protein (putative c-di-GMP-specific phosphodiesterase class I)
VHLADGAKHLGDVAPLRIRGQTQADGDDDKATAEAVVALGEALNFRVIADGVDESSQAEQFLGVGCKEAQRFLHWKPLTPAQVEGWVSHSG